MVDSDVLRLTTTEFLVILRQARDRFDWSLRPDTGRHSERRTTVRLHILGTPRDAPLSGPLDPVRAVCYVLTGEILVSETLAEVAEVLDLEERAAAVLVNAAHDRTWSEKDGVRSQDEHTQFIRYALLEAVGLSAEVDP